jgi:hypothetical protein
VHNDRDFGFTVNDYMKDPDYMLRWPPELFTEEIDRLIRRAMNFGLGAEWQEEVELLLRQAFSSPVPAEDFKKTFDLRASMAARDLDEEPF